MKVVEHREGKTRLLVPAVSLSLDPPPTSPVFFNPAASLNRDVSVAMAEAEGARSFCDSMAGVGARGVRVAKEASGVENVALVDFNHASLGLARRSAALNRVGRKCEFAESETSAFLSSRSGRDGRFDMVDVDPFGTPVGELQAALRAVSDGGIVSFTATDTAVLCGVYPTVCRRRYGATPLNNGFNHETGVRVLAGAAARLGAMVDLGVSPVAAHSTRHYLRLFLRVSVGASAADRALKNMGAVAWCPACGHTAPEADAGGTCSECGHRAKTAGPLWAGPLVAGGVARAAAEAATEKGLASAEAVLRSLEGVEAFPPWSFSVETACSSLKVPTVPEDAVYLNLKRVGRRAMRTPSRRPG